MGFAHAIDNTLYVHAYLYVVRFSDRAHGDAGKLPGVVTMALGRTASVVARGCASFAGDDQCQPERTKP